MEKNLAQLTGKWKQDHSQDENYDDFLRENYGLGWFGRKMMKLFKISPIQEYIVNGNQITFRTYTSQHGPPTADITLTIGQPTNAYINNFGHFQLTMDWDEYGRLVSRMKKGNVKEGSGEFVTTGRIDSKGQLDLSVLLPSGKTCRRVLQRLQ